MSEKFLDMTVRDYFAAKAMQSIIQARATLSEDSDVSFSSMVDGGVNETIGLMDGDANPPRQFTWGELLAVESYEIADAMLKARQK